MNPTAQTYIIKSRKPTGNTWRPGFHVWVIQAGTDALIPNAGKCGHVTFDSSSEAIAAAQAITHVTGHTCEVMRYSVGADSWTLSHSIARTEAQAVASH